MIIFSFLNFYNLTSEISPWTQKQNCILGRLVHWLHFHASLQVACDPPVTGQFVQLQKLQGGSVEVEEIDVVEEQAINDGSYLSINMNFDGCPRLKTDLFFILVLLTTGTNDL